MRAWLWMGVLLGAALAQTFEVASGEARYRVREQLVGIGFADAVGTTGAVKGQVLLQEARASGEFVVDLRELRSDQARRDNYLRQNTLQTDRFPTATFRPRAVEGLPSPLPQSGNLPVRVVGDLTLRDVTEEVAWEGEAEFRGQEVRVVLRTEFPFERFRLVQPRVTVVLSVENRIRLEVDLTLRRR
ncbi:YceI family protein [Thermus thermamylovorans]|uniref:YceI family protein n=1 Tax=Thermus thermamylovorans TaxID=2509362 RepID=A0A4Q9AZL6_9DEIN|nr:YceI family protein [Thermus thermamylovorans]TBH17631.1 YceI family protein [Thermus thermamylovorans]